MSLMMIPVDAPSGNALVNPELIVMVYPHKTHPMAKQVQSKIYLSGIEHPVICLESPQVVIKMIEEWKYEAQ